MSEQNNATCKICGKGYRVCNDCLEMKEFTPWRAVADRVEHFLIYLAIHGYTVTGDKNQARKELLKCNLDGKDSFLPEIRAVIDEILGEMSKDSKATSVAKKNPKAHKSVDVIAECADIAETQPATKD